MFHPLTCIQYIDSVIEADVKITLQAMFEKFSLLSAPDGYGHIIDFASVPTPTVISDLYGWTHLLSMRKDVIGTDGDAFRQSFGAEILRGDKVIWYKIYCGKSTIIVSSSQLVPIYEPSSHYKGFHGEDRYAYTLKFPDEIKEGDMMRLKLSKDVDDEFLPVTVSNEFDSKIDNIGYGYTLITRSNTFSVLPYGLHMLGSRDPKIIERYRKVK